jgi:predicted PhzF superfamily epimerase YddE/YHI9
VSWVDRGWAGFAGHSTVGALTLTGASGNNSAQHMVTTAAAATTSSASLRRRGADHRPGSGGVIR